MSKDSIEEYNGGDANYVSGFYKVFAVSWSTLQVHYISNKLYNFVGKQ
jgi:hypothetical protein